MCPPRSNDSDTKLKTCLNFWGRVPATTVCSNCVTIATPFFFLAWPENRNKKPPTLTGARGKMVFAVPPWFIDASRRQPQRVSWEKRAVSSYNTPASNGADRRSLLTDKAFNLQLRV